MKRLLASALALSMLSVPALAGDITVEDPYARSSNPRSGAAFMVIRNAGEAERLVAARADIAERVELHTHLMENGIMKMREVEGGIEIPSDGMAHLKRGGLHVMFLGLKAPMEQGQAFPLTLVFESGQEITVEVPVDLERMPGDMKHGG